MIKAKNNLNKYRIIAIIVLLILIAVCWIYVFWLEKQHKDTSWQENIFLKSKIQAMEEQIDDLANVQIINEADSKNNSETEIIDQGQKININTASKEELENLTGIGPTKANDIISYREENDFEKIEDIQNVKGIGPATFEKIKNEITVD